MVYKLKISLRFNRILQQHFLNRTFFVLTLHKMKKKMLREIDRVTRGNSIASKEIVESKKVKEKKRRKTREGVKM